MGVPVISDQEEPTEPGVPRARRKVGGIDVEAIEGLCHGLRTYGFRVALLVPQLRKGPMTPVARGRLGQDLRELGSLLRETADTIDPRSTE